MHTRTQLHTHTRTHAHTHTRTHTHTQSYSPSSDNVVLKQFFQDIGLCWTHSPATMTTSHGGHIDVTMVILFYKTINTLLQSFPSYALVRLTAE